MFNSKKKSQDIETISPNDTLDEKKKLDKKQGQKNLKKKNSVASTQKSIPFVNAYKNGIIESANGFFTKSYELQDINFRIASDEMQESIFSRFESFLNTFDANTRLQICVNNRNIDEKSVKENILCKFKNDELNDMRKEMNSHLETKLSEGRNNLVSDKTLIVGTYAKDIKAAAISFSTRIDPLVSTQIKKIISKQNVFTQPSSIEERFKCIHDLYNLGEEQSLPNNFDLNDYIHRGLHAKDIVAPSGLKFEDDYIKLNDKYAQVMYLKALPSSFTTEFISEVGDLPFNLLASVYMEPVDQSKAMTLVKNQMVSINMNVMEAQKRAIRGQYSPDMIAPNLKYSQEQIQYLMDDMRSSNQKLFFTTIVIMHYADSLETLKENSKSIVALGNRYLCAIDKLYFQQEYGLDSALPLCNNKLSTSLMLKTENAALFIPFNSQELFQSGGIFYGLNGVTKNAIVLNRTSKENLNPNGLILGQPGSGKSVTAKLEIISVLLTRDENNEVYILDPEGEYAPMAEALSDIGAAVVYIAPGSGNYINPFDMDMNYAKTDEGSSDPVTLKSDYIGTLCETAMSGKFGLTNVDRSIIDRCVRALYAPYLEHMSTLDKSITIDINASPIMDDFYQMLMEQPEPEATNIALALEIYCRGSFDTFAHRTNVNVDKRLVVYNIRDIGNGMKELGLQVCLNHVWNKTIANFSKKVRTWFYIDEFHILTRSESSANFLMNIWKRSRKWNGIPTAITQNVEDLLKSEASRAIITNCNFVIILAQSQIDREFLRDFYKISETQLEYITNSPSGQGLIYTGQSILPFINIFPSNTNIYKVITTSPDDKK